VKTLEPWVEVLPSGFQRTFCASLNSFRSSRVEVLPVASEVLRTAEPASTAAPQGNVRPVAQCGPRCRVRRDSALVYVSYDGIAAQCGPFGVELRLLRLHDFFAVFTTSQWSSRLRGSTRLPASTFNSQRCHVAALGRSCSGRPDVEDVALPLKPAGSLTFRVILPKGHPQVII
jgi:hypothetical protein